MSSASPPVSYAGGELGTAGARPAGRPRITLRGGTGRPVPRPLHLHALIGVALSLDQLASRPMPLARGRPGGGGTRTGATGGGVTINSQGDHSE